MGDRELGIVGENGRERVGDSGDSGEERGKEWKRKGETVGDTGETHKHYISLC